MHIKFDTVMVEDQDRALRFYTDALGMELLQDMPLSEDGDARWVELGLDGGQTSLVLWKAPAVPESQMPVLALAADDIRGLEQTLSGAGAEITQAVAPAPWNPGELHLIFRDSEGNLVLITQPA